MSERVTREDAGGLCTLTLQRPEKLNALDMAAFEALDAHIAELEQDGSIGCVVLRGVGRGFCAGADLGDIEGGARPRSYRSGVITRLSRLRTPVIAAVHGVCFTGGLELALACDFIVAESGARFADTHGKWGLVGSWGMSQRLPRRIGVTAAKRMMMTARVVEAPEAVDLGLVDLLAPSGELAAVVGAFAGELLANSWFTNVETKRLLIETDALSLADGLAYEQAHHPGRAPDWRERIERFRKG